MAPFDESKEKENCEPMTSAAPSKSGFSAASLSLRAQKKLASKLSTRAVAKQFVSPTASKLFDCVYELLARFYPKKEAEKTVKNLIKLAVKLALVSRAGNLSTHEQDLLRTSQQRVRSMALTIVSFNKVSYSYDRSYLLSQCALVRAALEPVVGLHLSDKSEKRLDHVFEHLGSAAFLDAVFQHDGKLADGLPILASNLDALIESKEL